jgi:hypothetical protein
MLVLVAQQHSLQITVKREAKLDPKKSNQLRMLAFGATTVTDEHRST